MLNCNFVLVSKSSYQINVEKQKLEPFPHNIFIAKHFKYVYAKRKCICVVTSC